MARKTATRKAGKASSPRQRRARRAAGRDDRSDYRNKRRAEKIEAGSKKGGCAPKLFMLLLPFAATGTYLLLRA
ncbi:MAG: hypothetical protein V1755_08445 [Chloroflexota bacterium]